jgi:hypothetical protein
MRSFKEFLIEYTQLSGTYAAVKPSKNDSNILEKFISDNNIPNPEPIDKLHATLLYSRKPLPSYKPDPKLTHLVLVDKLEIWPTKSGKNCLVLKLKSDDLSKRHLYLMNKHKATYDYPEFKVHISLSYDVGDYDISKLNIKYLPKTIKLDGEYHEPLDTSGK